MCLFIGGPGSLLTLNPASRSACFTVPLDEYVTRMLSVPIMSDNFLNISLLHSSGCEFGEKVS